MRRARTLTRIVPLAALGLFVVYCGWNVAYLVWGRVPDSILHALTGLPCPTTGGVRSFAAYLQGHWLEGFLFNPFAPLLAGLFLVSVAILAWRAVRRQRVRLPGSLGIAWLVCLGLAWVTKFALGPAYW
jgi:hypothetical protein